MGTFWSGLAEGIQLRKKYGAVCGSCLGDHDIADGVLEKRLNREHDATCWMSYGKDSSARPFCDKHRDYWMQRGWGVK